MKRAGSVTILLVLALVSLGAVILVQHIEAAGSPIGTPHVTHAFSPNGDGVLDTAAITVGSSHHDDTISIKILNAHNQPVAEIAHNRHIAGPTTLHWNGRGTHSREGTYKVQIASKRAGRSITLPATIQLDTTAPRLSNVRFDQSRIGPPLHTLRIHGTVSGQDKVSVQLLHGGDAIDLPIISTHVFAVAQRAGATTMIVSVKVAANDLGQPIRFTASDAAGNSVSVTSARGNA